MDPRMAQALGVRCIGRGVQPHLKAAGNVPCKAARFAVSIAGAAAAKRRVSHHEEFARQSRYLF